MADKRDEFQELIRSFSLDQQTPQRPSSNQQRQPVGQQRPSAIRQQNSNQQQRTRAQVGDDFLRHVQASAPQSSSGTVRTQTPKSTVSSDRFNPSGFETSAAPQQNTSFASGRFNPSGFDAQTGQGHTPSSGVSHPVSPTAVPQSKNFQLNMNDADYHSTSNIRMNPGTPSGSSGAGAPPRTPSGSSGASAASPAPDESHTQKNPKKKRQKRRGGVLRFFEALIIASSLVLVAVFLSIFALQSVSDFLGMNKEDHTATLTIEGSPTITELSEQLYDAGIITQPLTFRIYGTLTRDDGEVYQEGTYELNSKMAYSQLLDRLSRGSRTEVETVRLTFPEGRTIVQIAEELEANGVCTAEDFFEAADNGNYGFEFEELIPDDPHRFHRLEGYIFPDTYDFYVPESADSVVAKFLRAFNTNVTQDLYDVIEMRGLTLDQTITLASIIQKEAGDVGLMYDVSSVFHNRLAAGMRLESDATSDYIENQILPSVDSPSQSMLDAYDTYVCSAFPVGPINNPGIDAINAALDPTESSYYFFLSDQKGEYHFSETLAQHQAYMNDAGDAHGTATGHNISSESAE